MSESPQNEHRKNRNKFREKIFELKERIFGASFQKILDEIYEILELYENDLSPIDAAFTVKPFPVFFDIIKNCDIQYYNRDVVDSEKYKSNADCKEEKQELLVEGTKECEKEKSNKSKSQTFKYKGIRMQALRVFQICSRSIHFNYEQDFSDRQHITFFTDFIFNNELEKEEIDDILLILTAIVKRSRNPPCLIFEMHVLKKLTNVRGSSLYLGELLFLIFKQSKRHMNSDMKESYLNIANSILSTDEELTEQTKYALYIIYGIISMDYSFNINITIDYINEIIKEDTNNAYEILLPPVVRIIGKACTEFPYFQYVAGYLERKFSYINETEIIQSTMSALIDSVDRWGESEELKEYITNLLINILETQPVPVKETAMKLLRYTCFSPEQYTEKLISVLADMLNYDSIKNESFEHLIQVYGVLEGSNIGSFTEDDFLQILHSYEHLLEEEVKSNEIDEVREFCTIILEKFEGHDDDL
jgi:hypothetical protein